MRRAAAPQVMRGRLAAQSERDMASSDDLYEGVGIVVGAIAGIATWLYAVASWGFLLGVGFGWIPGLIVGTLAAYLWPLLLVCIVGIAVLLWEQRASQRTTDQLAQRLAGVWEGAYECPQGLTHAVLTIRPEGGPSVVASLQFGPSPQYPAIPKGSYKLRGTLQSDRSVTLTGERWLSRPPNWGMVTFSGRLQRGDTVFNGTVPECSEARFHFGKQ